VTPEGVCLGCGRESEPADRFCADCGLSLEPEPGDSPPAVSGAAASTIRKSPSGVSTESTASEARSSLRARVFTAAVLAVVGWAALRIFQPPTEALADVAATLTAVDARVPDAWFRGPPGEPLIDHDLESFVDRTASVADGVPIPDLSENVLPSIDLEELIGLDDHWLIVSNTTHLVRLDPATGEAVLQNPRGLVVGHHRDRLVVVNGAGRGIHSVSIVDPDDERRLLREGDRSDIARLDLPGDGTLTVGVWRLPSDPNANVEDLESLTIDLDSGQTVRRFSSLLSEEPGVGFSPGYGSYEIDADGGIRLFEDGFVEASGDRLALVRRCGDPDTCQRYWLDRQSGRRIDRRIPASVDGFGIVDVLGPDDRIVTVYDGSRRWYFDTVSGAYLLGPENPTGRSRFDQAAEVVSPDGRYLIVPIRSGAAVHDLESGTSGIIAVDLPGWPQSVVLVPKPGDG